MHCATDSPMNLTNCSLSTSAALRGGSLNCASRFGLNSSQGATISLPYAPGMKKGVKRKDKGNRWREERSKELSKEEFFVQEKQKLLSRNVGNYALPPHDKKESGIFLFRLTFFDKCLTNERETQRRKGNAVVLFRDKLLPVTMELQWKLVAIRNGAV